MKTQQEVFDIVANHLLTQNARANISSGPCLYRAPNGCKCAFGILIPDSIYHPSMEFRSAISVIREYAEAFHSIGINDIDHGLLCNSLQHIHDSVPVSAWKEELKACANFYSLNSEVLDKY